jgi:hypothetical protein
MNHISFKRDFAYKFIKPTSFITSLEKPKIILPLWRSNRLSLVRAYFFLMQFFKDFSLIKKVTINIKYKRADKKTHKKSIYYFQIPIFDTDFFVFFLNFLPEPKVIGSTTGYVLIYPFHHFVMQIPCNIHESVFTYRFIPCVIRNMRLT